MKHALGIIVLSILPFAGFASGEPSGISCRSAAGERGHDKDDAAANGFATAMKSAGGSDAGTAIAALESAGAFTKLPPALKQQIILKQSPEKVPLISRGNVLSLEERCAYAQLWLEANAAEARRIIYAYFVQRARDAKTSANEDFKRAKAEFKNNPNADTAHEAYDAYKKTHGKN